MGYQKSETKQVSEGGFQAAPGFEGLRGLWGGHYGAMQAGLGQYSPQQYTAFLQQQAPGLMGIGQSMFDPARAAAGAGFQMAAQDVARSTFGGASGQNALYSGAAQSAFGRGLGQAYQQMMMPIEMAAAGAGQNLLGTAGGLYGQTQQLYGGLFGQAAQPITGFDAMVYKPDVWGQNQWGFSLM